MGRPRQRLRLRAVAGHVVPGYRPAPCAEEVRPKPATEGWISSAAHGFIPYTVTEADRQHFVERGYLLLPPVLVSTALDALLEDVQFHWDTV